MSIRRSSRETAAPSRSIDVAAGTGQIGGRLAHVDPDADDDGIVTVGLREDPGQLAGTGAPVEGVAVHHDVVGPLEAGGHSMSTGGLRDRDAREERQDAPLTARRHPHEDREPQAGPRGADPRAAQPAAARGLLPGDDDGPLGSPGTGELEEVGVRRSGGFRGVRTRPRHLAIGEASLDEGGIHWHGQLVSHTTKVRNYRPRRSDERGNRRREQPGPAHHGRQGRRPRRSGAPRR